MRRFLQIALTPLLLLVGLAGAAQAAPPSARDFARAAAISHVSISPDGKHIVALTSPDGDQAIISVWATDALNKPPVNIAASKMRILNVGFLKNDRLLIDAIQTFNMGTTRGHLIKEYVTDLEGRVWKPLFPDEGPARSEDQAFWERLVDAELVSRLPLDPQNVIVVKNELSGAGDLYRINVYSGQATLLERGSDKFGNFQVDLKGQVRGKMQVDYDGGNVFFAQWIKHPDTGEWQEHFRWYGKDREPTELAGFTNDPNIVYVRSSKGRDKAGLYLYDIRARKILEPAFEHRMFEATNVIPSTATATFGEPLGFRYNGDAPSVYWTDPQLAAIAKSVTTALGARTAVIDWTDPGTGQAAKVPVADGFRVNITDYSDDLKYVIVEKSGPNVAGEYYLLVDGKLSLLGRSRPWIKPDDLGDSRLVEYPARDGLMIPAFLHTPPRAQFGAGPFPTLIVPHGGPWARDELAWDISGWTKYFTARGYAVLQPQFRGSQGWGQRLWRAGDGEWGQKMQDDKDDAVKWLIARGIADPKRVAMFGYSYGGYAALTAAIRPNGLYQCAISGAGAGDLAALKRATFENRFQREFQNPTIKGLDALDHAKEASIPVFLYHGDRDQTVKVEQSRKFAGALKSAGRRYRLLEIPDMGHQYVTMTPANLETQLIEVEKFLRTECKPGGL